jgi:hypothetical protein
MRASERTMALVCTCPPVLLGKILNPLISRTLLSPFRGGLMVVAGLAPYLSMR